MTIYINNEPKEITVPINLLEVLSVINISSTKGIAIAVNNIVISRSDWENYAMHENDKVTIIKATQGG